MDKPAPWNNKKEKVVPAKENKVVPQVLTGQRALLGRREGARFNWSRRIGRFQNVLEHGTVVCVCSSLLSHSVAAGFHGDDTSKQNRDNGLLLSIFFLVFHNVVELELEPNGPKGTDDRPQTTQQPDRNVSLKRGNVVKKTQP